MAFTAEKPAGNDTLAVSDDAIRENFRNVSPARDLFAEGFVQNGLETSINGTNAARLDVTAGTAYVKQTSSGDIHRYDKDATFFTTSVASTTYYLDLNEDGTYNWDTSHSSDSNYLPISEATTDSNADINSVTDARDTKPLLDMVLQDASKIDFGNTNFPSLASSFSSNTVAGALLALGDSSGVVEHNLDVSSPSNGYYVRWENGLQVCFLVYTTTISISNLNNGLYRNGSGGFAPSFPANFISKPKINPFSTTDSPLGSWVAREDSNTDNTQASLLFYSNNSLSSVVCGAFIIAIGRWK